MQVASKWRHALYKQHLRYKDQNYIQQKTFTSIYATAARFLTLQSRLSKWRKWSINKEKGCPWNWTIIQLISIPVFKKIRGWFKANGQNTTLIRSHNHQWPCLFFLFCRTKIKYYFNWTRRVLIPLFLIETNTIMAKHDFPSPRKNETHSDYRLPNTVVFYQYFNFLQFSVCMAWKDIIARREEEFVYTKVP